MNLYGIETFFPWFVLVSLFNGISTFVAYLMPKQSLKKGSSVIIPLIAGEMSEFMPFSRILVWK